MADARRNPAAVARAKVIFTAALELPAEQRVGFVCSECAGDEELRELVLKFLHAQGKPLPFDGIAEEIRVAGLAGATYDRRRESLPEGFAGIHIENYKLLQLIGEGGFGSVFLAEQERPIVRRVAIKIINLGMDTHQVVARFEQERQALALMDHPNIAKIFDAGNSDTGRPYFVMELVKGEPITDFCDKHRLSVPQRLELLGIVCESIHHAHSKGVIHRDIKPSNVLVSFQDGKPVVKVIDFGIAKAIDRPQTAKTLFTEHKLLVGTPEYMSPEQAEGSRDIDTRSDVYSVGVLLYEILVGTTPFDSQRLRSSAFAEMQRIIREEDPPRPSSRISRQLASPDSVAQARATLPARLFATIRGDLDWIVMKAMDKDRTRRYSSVSTMSEDIHRFLTGHEVVAAPPDAWYRARKFCRRNRAAVITALLVISALLAGFVGTAIGYRESVIANKNLGKALIEVKAQETQAMRSARREKAIHGFFLDRLLGANDPDISAGEDIRVRKVLDDAVKELATVTEPDLESSLRQEIGAVYLSLGMWKEAIVQLERTLQLRESGSASASDSDIGDTLILLSRATQIANDAARSEFCARRARSLRLAEFGEGSDQVAEADYYLAGALNRQGRLKEAAGVCERALGAMKMRHTTGSETSMMARIMVMYAAEYLSIEGRHTEAAIELRKAVAILRRNPNVESLLAWALSRLGTAAAELKEFDESDRSVQEAITIRQRLFPEGHTAIAQSLLSLGISRMRRGEAALGEESVLEAVRMYSAALGEEHEFVARSIVALGAILASQGKWAEAAEAYSKAVVLYKKNFVGDNAQTALVMSQQGGCLVELKDFHAAETLLLESWSMLERTDASSTSRVIAAKRLIQLYSTWENEKGEREWMQRLEVLSPTEKQPK